VEIEMSDFVELHYEKGSLYFKVDGNDDPKICEFLRSFEQSLHSIHFDNVPNVNSELMKVIGAYHSRVTYIGFSNCEFASFNIANVRNINEMIQLDCKMLKRILFDAYYGTIVPRLYEVTDKNGLLLECLSGESQSRLLKIEGSEYFYETWSILREIFVKEFSNAPQGLVNNVDYHSDNSIVDIMLDDGCHSSAINDFVLTQLRSPSRRA
jgi:hypothetical protein